MIKYPSTYYESMSPKEKILLLRELRERGVIGQTEYDNGTDNIIEKISLLDQDFDYEYNIKQVEIYENEIESKPDVYDSEYIVNSIKNYNKINPKSDEKMKSAGNVRLINIGFYLGITSIFIGRVVGIIPLIAIILTLIGYVQIEEYSTNIKRRAMIGLILGLIYFIMNLNYYGHL